MLRKDGTPRALRQPSVERTCHFCHVVFRCKASDGFQCCSRPCSDALRRSVTPLQRLQAKTEVSGDCWLWTGLRDKDGYGKTTVDGASVRTHRLAWLAATGHMPTRDEGVLHTCDVRACWRNDDVGTYEVGGIVYERHGHLWLGTNAANMADRDAKGHTTRGDAHWMRTNPEKIRRGDNHPSRLYPEKRPRGDQHWTRLHPERIASGDRSGARTHPGMHRGEKNGRARFTEATILEIHALCHAGELTQKEVGAIFGVAQAHINQIMRRVIWKDVPCPICHGVRRPLDLSLR